MKSLTKNKELPSQKTNNEKNVSKKETKAIAQCCAKVSKIVAGCHD